MFGLLQYYSWLWTKQLQAMVNHSDESYNCEKMSACPYTTIIINKIPWAGEAGTTQEAAQLYR